MLVEYFLNEIKIVEDFILFGPNNSKFRGGVFSFNIKGIHPHDMSTLLDREGIAIRGGHHCAMPLMGELNTCATSRISFYFYNIFHNHFCLYSIHASRSFFPLPNSASNLS